MNFRLNEFLRPLARRLGFFLLLSAITTVIPSAAYSTAFSPSDMAEFKREALQKAESIADLEGSYPAGRSEVPAEDEVPTEPSEESTARTLNLIEEEWSSDFHFDFYIAPKESSPLLYSAAKLFPVSPRSLLRPPLHA